MSYLKETIRRYNEIAPTYSSDWRGELSGDIRVLADEFLRVIGTSRATILDAGAGTGKVSRYFSESGHHVVGLDLSPGMLREVVSNPFFNAEQEFPVLGDMLSLPIESNSFDGVWCMASLVHIKKEDRPRAISEFYRVLKPDGVLCISVQNKLSPKHLRRMVESAFFEIGYDENNSIYRRPLSLGEILSNMKDFPSRIKDGYAFLDGRHWFFPSQKELKEAIASLGFALLKLNSSFSKRIVILAKKK